ncbi:MAG: hypothetical protein KAU95_02450, partial [Candidatus Aenigmarchaeota archaeon]|nr:hypothetical protein [Candidatus Aenigmarchaeota archaeon]
LSLLLEINLSTMCYINTSANITLYIPHLSGGVLVNDTLPPILNITNPENNSVATNSYFEFNFTSKEANPNATFCRFNLTNGTDTIENGTINNNSLVWVGTSGTYTEILREIGNGDYVLTLNCADLNNQSAQIYHNFTINDTTQPEITNISTSTTGTGTSKVTITLSVTTNENAVCRYSTLPNTTFLNMTNNISTLETTNHSMEISYTSDDSGTYYIRCSDTAGNEMNTSNTTNYNADVTTEKTTSPGGGSSGGTYTQSYWTSTYLVNDENFEAGYTKTLKEKRRLRVKVNNEIHHVGIVNLTNTTITINVSSATQQATLSIGEEKKFDVTDDNYYDIYVWLNNIVNSTANLTIKKIHEEIFEEEKVCEENWKRCSGNNLEKCADNFWELIQTCEFGCNETTLMCNTEPMEKVCIQGEKRCFDDKLQECRNNKWTIIETCNYGCNSTTLICNPEQIEKPEEKYGLLVTWIINAITIIALAVFMLLF